MPVKNLSMLVWLTQLGLSVALPPVGFIWLAVWLSDRYGWGSWVIWMGVLLGIVCAVDGLRTSLKAMSRLAQKDPKEKPPIAYNDHD
jgi:hypothetical protein